MSTSEPANTLEDRLGQLIGRAERSLTEAGFTTVREPINPYQSHITDYGPGHIQAILTATVAGSEEVFEVSVTPDVHSDDGFSSSVTVFDQGSEGWGFSAPVAEHTPGNVDPDPLRTVIAWMVERNGMDTPAPPPLFVNGPGPQGPGTVGIGM